MDPLHHRILPLLIGTLFACLILSPLANAPDASILGASCSAAVDTVWRLWATPDGLSTGSFHVGYPRAATELPVASPVISAVFAQVPPLLGQGATGIARTWNAVIVGALICAVLGTWALARRLSPDGHPLAHATVVFAVVGSTGWAALIQSGHLEDLPAMLLPLGMALLHRWVQPGARWPIGILAGAVLMLSVLTRWPMTVFVIAMLIPMAALMGRHLKARDGLMRMSVALGPAVLAGLVHVAYSNGIGGAATTEPLHLAPAWVIATQSELILPATATVALPSLGILLLTLAGVAARPRSCAGWLLCGAWGILLAGGIDLQSWRSIQPAQQLSRLFPVLGEIKAWWEIAPLVSIPLGITAMYGVDALHKVRRDSLALGVLLIALVDQGLAIHHTPWSERRLDIAPPAGLSEAFEHTSMGAVLHLPRTDTLCAAQDRAKLWQRAHGRPISPASTGDGALTISYLSRLAHRLQSTPGPRPSKDSPIIPHEYTCSLADLTTLKDVGFSAVLLDHTLPAHPSMTEALKMVLGVASVQTGDFSLWSLDEAEISNPSAPCALPPMASRGPN